MLQVAPTIKSALDATPNVTADTPNVRVHMHMHMHMHMRACICACICA